MEDARKTTEAGCLHGIIGRCDECRKIAVRMGVPGFRITAGAADRLSGVREVWVVRAGPSWYRNRGEVVRGRENAEVFADKLDAISAMMPGDSVRPIKVHAYNELEEMP